jgi:hypothetical protein
MRVPLCAHPIWKLLPDHNTLLLEVEVCPKVSHTNVSPSCPPANNLKHAPVFLLAQSDMRLQLAQSRKWCCPFVVWYVWIHFLPDTGQMVSNDLNCCYVGTIDCEVKWAVAPVIVHVNMLPAWESPEK